MWAINNILFEYDGLYGFGSINREKTWFSKRETKKFFGTFNTWCYENGTPIKDKVIIALCNKEFIRIRYPESKDYLTQLTNSLKKNLKE